MFAELLSEIDDSDDKFIKAFIETYMELDKDSRDVLEYTVMKLSSKMKKWINQKGQEPQLYGLPLVFASGKSEAFEFPILVKNKMINPHQCAFIGHFRNHPYDLFPIVHICLLSKTACLSPHMGELSFP